MTGRGWLSDDQSSALFGKAPVVRTVVNRWLFLGAVAALAVLLHYC